LFELARGGRARGARLLVLALARRHEARVDRVGDVDRLAGARVVELPDELDRTLLLVDGERAALPLGVVALGERGLVVRAARLVAVPRAGRDDAREHQHVL